MWWNKKPTITCCICLDCVRNDKVTLQCGHQYHSICAHKWLKFKSTCPSCRAIDLGTSAILQERFRIQSSVEDIVKHLNDCSGETTLFDIVLLSSIIFLISLIWVFTSVVNALYKPLKKLWRYTTKTNDGSIL